MDSDARSIFRKVSKPKWELKTMLRLEIAETDNCEIGDTNLAI